MSQPSRTRDAAADLEGRFRMRASLSAGVIGAYALMLLLIVYVVGFRTTVGFGWVTYFLLAVTILFLARYLSVTYAIDDTNLVARTMFGTHRWPLEEIRGIEYASLRELAPTGGLLSSWVWRGKMYSPTIGEFELVFTEAASGLLVTASPYPLFISPRVPKEFARELSRRVRSYTGPLLKDVGQPSGAEPASGRPPG